MIYSSPISSTDFAACFESAKWYAVYTRSRHEKSVAELLRRKAVEHFLPLYRALHQWRSRTAEVESPLFPGYVFVHVRSDQLLPVLRTAGVVRFVGTAGSPAPIPQVEIERIQVGLGAGLALEPHEYLAVGERVQIQNGPLAGVEGLLLRRGGSFRVILSVGLISRSVSVEVSSSDIGPCLAEHRV